MARENTSSSSSFGQTLKALRKKAGLTQEELAHRSNFSVMTIRRWEWGNTHPNLEDIKKLAETLHVSEHQLLSTENQASAWVLTVKIAHDFSEEVIDVDRSIPRKSSIITTSEGGYLCLGGDYSLWQDDNNFKNFIKDLKKLRSTVIQNGIALGGIKIKEA